MTRTRIAAVTAVVACLVAAQAGAATAEVTPTPAPTPSVTPVPAAAAEDPVNVAPVAEDDPGDDQPSIDVRAGRSVTVAVLANDTDDGLGRPQGEAPRLEVATFDALGGRVTLDATHTELTVAARPTDSGTLTFTYTATDGELSSAAASVTVDVTPAPVVRTVSLKAPRTFVALHRYSLHGTVRPPKPGRAAVVVQRKVSGRWTRLKADNADRNGRYAVSFSTNRPARTRFRAVATFPDRKKATSPTLRRTVVARPETTVSGPLSRRAVPYSYRAGCPVGPAGLRRLTINRFTYSHVVARGSLIVKASAVRDLREVFEKAFAQRFPIRSMKPTDTYYAHGRRTPTQSDIAAMKADNTSAFNCRPVTGNPYRVSQHSYGNAIDINTVRNPYVVGNRVYPSWARTYLNRRHVRTGMILPTGVIARTMRGNGWPWGARWAHPDYQHFSANGG